MKQKKARIKAREKRKSKLLARLIAFYLPQFHPIPENNEWWGKGFTEWRNVVRAKPLFKGHHQPNLPADLGFYDLRIPEVREHQAKLAKKYGIEGFCYWHYWFKGKLLLEKPVLDVIESGKPDFPFCLAWANEPWSRRWSGEPLDVLQPQVYGAEKDNVRHFKWLLPAFKDPRAIKIDGKPVFLIYRADQIPNIKDMLTLWQKLARKHRLPGLYFISIETTGTYGADPRKWGFDAAVEFQPNWQKCDLFSRNTGSTQFKKVFSGGSPNKVEHKLRTLDYKELWPNLFMKKEPDYPLYPSVFPGWDNTPRRKEKGLVINNSSPNEYGKWLRKTIEKISSSPKEHRIVFINAWNEWAEGNYLEPDMKYGHSYLMATYQANNVDHKKMNERSKRSADLFDGNSNLLTAENHALITDLENKIKDKDVNIADLDGIIRKKDAHISSLEAATNKNAEQIESLEADFDDHITRISSLETTIKNKDIQLGSLESTVKDKNSQIADLNGIISTKSAHILDLEKRLRPWEMITKPFALIHDYFGNLIMLAKRFIILYANRMSDFPEEFGFRGYLDEPKDKAKCTLCRGWFISKKPFKRIELFIGNRKIADVERTVIRKDVDNTNSGYPPIHKKGFDLMIPNKSLWELKNKKRILFLRFYTDELHYVDKFYTKCRFGEFSTQEQERLLAGNAAGMDAPGLGGFFMRIYWTLAGNALVIYPLFNKIMRHYFTEDLSRVNSFMPQLFAELITFYKKTRNGPQELYRDLKAIAPGRTLSSRSENSAPPQAKHGKKLKILFVSGMFPSTNHGGGLRLFDILSELSKTHEVDLFAIYKSESDGPYLDQVRKLVNNMKVVQDDQMNEDALSDWLEAIKRTKQYYDIIQLEYPSTISLADKVRRFGKKIGFTFMESISRRNAIDVLLHINNPAERSELVTKFIRHARSEGEISKKADFTIAMTPRDRDFSSKFGGKVPYIIPTGISKQIVNASIKKDDKKPFYSASYVGNFEHAPNIDAMKWYLQYIHPLIKRKINDYKIEVVGYGDTALLEEMAKSDPSVVFAGFVDDITKHILNSRISIAPIISGAGIRGKINHSSILGRPTISTSLGLCGLPYVHEESILQADSPEDFTEGMFRLLTDDELYRNISANCHRVAMQNFTWNDLIKKLESIYYTVLQKT